MTLAELTVTQLRCIEQAQLEIPPGLTLICGGNGSGKTSLLEAIFLLGRGRSFRTRNSERLIRLGKDHLKDTGEIRPDIGHPRSIGFQTSHNATSPPLHGKPVESLPELALAVP